jgi:membrane-associated phospholipid phosphatase
MDPLNTFLLNNDWLIWIFLSIGLVILYFLLRTFVWKAERPDERIVLKRFLIVFLISITITVLVIHGLKSTLQSPRPCIPCMDEVTDCNPYCPPPWDYSFPSGHAGTAFTLFMSFFMIYRKKWFIPLFILPALVAYSRIFLGVHVYVDIIAGSFIGIVIPAIVWKIESMEGLFRKT